MDRHQTPHAPRSIKICTYFSFNPTKLHQAFYKPNKRFAINMTKSKNYLLL